MFREAEIDIWCLHNHTLSYFLSLEFTGWVYWLTRQVSACLYLLCPSIRVCAFTTMPGFYMSTGDPNPCLQSWVASTSAEPDSTLYSSGLSWFWLHYSKTTKYSNIGVIPSLKTHVKTRDPYG